MIRPQTVSLFCGAGGETLGKALAFEELGIPVDRYDATAVNHWELAVLTHGRNFPDVHVVQEDVTQVTARDFNLDRIDLLWASPSCVHHSRARGGKPRDDQERSHADEVVDRWLRVADVRVLLVENVPEFAEWGPLDDNGQPVQNRKGEFFRRFVATLREIGYTVEWRILCAADYGDPTTRRRLFLQAVKDGVVAWPEPTHRDPKKPVDLFNGGLPAWRTAAECIDWSIPAPSIFTRKRPLKDATLRRIAHGVMKHVVTCPRPFLVNMAHRGSIDELDVPMSTIATEKGGCRALVVPKLEPAGPFLVNLTHGGRVEDLDEPFKTVSGANRGEKALVVPTLIQTGYGERDGQAPRALDLHSPLGSVVAGGAKHALVAAFLAKHYGGAVGQPVDRAMGTVTAVDHHSLVAASLVTMRGTGDDQVRATGGSVEAPLGTVSGGGVHHAVVAAFLQQYYSQGGNASAADDPVPAVTTKARHAVVTVAIDGQSYALADIGMRMLEPRELARAMGFPDWYQFESVAGQALSKQASIKMIGNACPVNTVKQLIKAVVLQRRELFGLGAA